MGVTTIAFAAFTYGVGRAISELLSEDPDTPVKDEKPTTLSSRGSYLPLVIGRERLGPFFGWAGNRYDVIETSSSGGKGFTGGGVDQITYFEDGAHFLCVGPGYALHRLWIDGQEWKPDGGPLTPENFPDGAGVDVIIEDPVDGDTNMGTLIIYWGFADGKVDADFAADSKMGINSRFPYVMRAFWKDHRLGGVPRWSLVEYDVEVRPFKSGWTAGLDWDDIPAEFDAGTPWLNGFFGPSEEYIEVLEYNTAGSTAVISVADDQSNKYVAGERCTIKDNAQGSTNGTYRITAVQYQPSGVVAYPGPLTRETGFPDFGSWIPGANTNVVTSGINTPSTGDFEEWSNTAYAISDPGAGSLASAGSATYDVLNRFTVWVYGGGLLDVVDYTIRLQLDGGSGAHYVEFSKDGQFNDPWQIDIQSNGATGEIFYFGFWAALSLTYPGGGGTTPSAIGETLNARILFDDGSQPIGVFNPLVETTPELIEVGVTRITLDQNLFNPDPVYRGEIQHWAQGLGPQGPNPAHALHQLLFAPYPHGAGVDPEDYFVYNEDGVLDGRFRSLQALSTLAINREVLNAHITLKDGDTFRSGIENFLMDMGWLISWDVDFGLFCFQPLRDPADSTLVGPAPTVEITHESIVDSYPVTEYSLEGNNANRQSFSYREIDRNFKNDSVVTGSDAGLLGESVQRKNDTKLFIARDRSTAELISRRRAQEAINLPAVFEMTCNHEVGRLWPGVPFRITGLNDVDPNDYYRLLEIQSDPYTSEVQVSAIFDNYSLREGPTTSNLTLSLDNFNGSFVPGVNDAALALVELPAAISGTSNAFTVLRIRASRRIENTNVYISRDGVSYVPLGRQVSYTAGGVLFDEWPDTMGDEEFGPIFKPLGEDTADLVQTLTTENFQNGRQVVYMGGEWFFVKSIEPMPGGNFQLKDFHRAKFGSSATTHARDTELFIFNPASVPVYKDILASPGATVVIKSAPKASSRVSLTDASTSQATITGIAGPSTTTIHSGDESDLTATYPPADYNGSTVLLQNTSSQWTEYYSDGTTWQQVM